MIFILTGPIGSGKTTHLMEWVEALDDVGGILMPVIESERCLYSIHSGELISVELKDDVPKDEVIKIGKYRFSKNVFEWGNRVILKAFDMNKTIVIDEAGPLELNRKGFFRALKKISDSKEKSEKKIIVLVVREGLADEVVNFFNIKKFELIKNPLEIK